MTRIGRYWLFFVIVAVGLALSWGQVGRKTHQVLQDKPVALLNTEADCHPTAAPCAAFGSDRAVIVGPGDGDRLLVKTAGFDDVRLLSVDAVLLAADGSERRHVSLLADDSAWRLPLLTPADAGLRFRLTAERMTTVAEFWLTDRQ